jgi:CRP-like cAMP-binding protein
MRNGDEIETLKQAVILLGKGNQISKRQTLNKSVSQGVLSQSMKRTMTQPLIEIPELKQEDWELILEIFNSKDNILTFMKGDVIIQQGLYYNVIFQIIRGNCRVEISETNNDNNYQQSSIEKLVELKISQGDIIGEIAMLTGCPADMSVIADDDFVDVYYIDGKYVHDILFQTHPHIVVKFYNYLCLNLVKLISRKEEELWKSFGGFSAC